MAIDFTCPHCHARTQVSSEFAGRTGPCAHCGRPITVPALAAALDPHAPIAAAQPHGRRGLMWLFVALGVVFLLVIPCGLIALLLPAVSAARQAAWNAQCKSNLRQIGLALHNYNSSHGCYPPQYITDENGRQMHSWRVLILPFLEEQELYDQYKFDEPWDGPHNRELARRMPPAFGCPDDPDANSEFTSYVASAGIGRMFQGSVPVTTADIRDGTSNTIAVVEFAGSHINWMSPNDGETPVAGQPPGATPQFSHHPGGGNVLYADGSVQFIPTGMLNPAHLTIDAGD